VSVWRIAPLAWLANERASLLGRAAATATALVIGLVAGLAAGGVAQAAERMPVRIIAPAGGAHAYGDLTVRVRTASRAPRLRVTMYGRGGRLRDVTSRFRRVGAHVFAGKLRAGRELAVGRNHIYVKARAGSRGADELHVLLARRARRPLVLRRREHGRYERPPLDVTVRGSGSILRARLNGVRARSSFVRTGAGRWSAHLSTKDGLRFGRNRLVVSVFNARGTYRRAVRTVWVRRDRPLVEAGRDRVVRVGRSIRLDGRLTRPGRKALGLRLSWRIVRKPRGSHPRLVGAHGRRPRLITDVAGRYRIALRARHARSASAAAVAATVNPQVTDLVDVTAAPDLPPSGEPLQTMVTQGGTVGISVGGQFHPMAAGAVIQLLAIDRETLTVDEDKSYYPGEDEVLLGDVANLTAADIVVLSGGGRPYVTSGPYLGEAISSIGATWDGESPVGVFSALTTGGWSFVGIPGIPQGQAYQLLGLQLDTSQPVGAMDGRLQVGSDGTHYAFTWAPEYHSFDTSRSRTSIANAIAVDGYPYPSENLPGGNAGYQLLWFDADTLTGRDTETFNADVYDPQQPYGMWGLLRELQVIAADPKPALLLINTIGDVQTPFYTAKAGIPSSECTGYDNCPTGDRGSDGNDSRGVLLARITTLLQEFGANPYVYIMAGSSPPGDPGTPGGYSLVGVTGLNQLKGPNAAAELSTRLGKSKIAWLTGVLKRSRQGVLMPSSTGSPGAYDNPALLQPGLQRILGQPDQPFAPFSTPGQKAAVTYIADQLNLTPDPKFGIRGLYWLEPTDDWKGNATKLETMAACKANCPAGYNDTDFTAVKNELATEFNDVYWVRLALTDHPDYSLRQIFNDTFLSTGELGFTSIRETVSSYYDPPVSATDGPNALGIMSGVLGLAGAIGAFVPVGEAFAATAELGAAMANLVEASTSEEDGASPFDPYGFRSTTAMLATDLLNAYKSGLAALDRAEDLIVSDAGRLKASGALAQKSAEVGGWKLNDTLKNQLETSLQQTMQQYMWLTMAQPVFATYECAIEDANTMKTRKNYNPGAVLQTNINFPQLQSPDTKYLASWWNLYPTSIMLAQRNRFGWPSLVSDTITNKLFNATDNDGLGFRPEYFLASANAADTDDSDHTYLSRPLTPTSSGLLHKNMNMWHDVEKAYPIASRAIWSMYTPSCGFGQRLRWSAPDPKAPDYRDPVKSSDPHWDPSTNPYRDP
jgi:hypothetical protein